MHKAKGFTIVELLIVIVVIAILAALSYVSYSNVSANARNSERDQDVSTITKALELYYADNGRYPTSSGSGHINSSWSSSADASWQHLATQLRPYVDSLPVDPVNDGSGIAESYGYSYFSNSVNSYCGSSGIGQFYILAYRREGSQQKQKTIGDCTANSLSYPNSWYRSTR